VIMRLDDRQAPDKHQDAGEIDNGWYLGVVEMRLHKRKLRNYHRHQSWTNEAGDAF
jgi:hypothetical protein